MLRWVCSLWALFRTFFFFNLWNCSVSFQLPDLFSYSPSTKKVWIMNEFEEWKKMPCISLENTIESVKSFLKNLPSEAKKSELYSSRPCMAIRKINQELCEISCYFCIRGLLWKLCLSYLIFLVLFLFVYLFVFVFWCALLRWNLFQQLKEILRVAVLWSYDPS